MTKSVRGVFFTCDDFQGNDAASILNAKEAAELFKGIFEQSFLETLEKKIGRKPTKLEIQSFRQRVQMTFKVIKAVI